FAHELGPGGGRGMLETRIFRVTQNVGLRMPFVIGISVRNRRCLFSFPAGHRTRMSIIIWFGSITPHCRIVYYVASSGDDSAECKQPFAHCVPSLSAGRSASPPPHCGMA